MYSPRLHRSSNSLNPLEIPLVKAPRARPSQREPAAPGANGASPRVAATPSAWPNTTLRLRRGPLTEFANGIFKGSKEFKGVKGVELLSDREGANLCRRLRLSGHAATIKPGLE